jgi:hypothetical protein
MRCKGCNSQLEWQFVLNVKDISCTLVHAHAHAHAMLHSFMGNGSCGWVHKPISVAHHF